MLPLKSAYLDGELCALEDRGISDFSALQAAIGDGRDADLVYFVFDLMFLDGVDLRQRPLSERRTLLEHLFKSRSRKRWAHIQLSQEIEADGAAFFKQACKQQLEGIISKRTDAPYRSGRTKSWIKIKCSPRQELVIAGFTPHVTGRGIGALLLGHYEGKELIYDGRVGTGFSFKLSLMLERRLKAMAIKDCPMKKMKRSHAEDATWVRPELVCEVKFASRTTEGLCARLVSRNSEMTRRPGRSAATDSKALPKPVYKAQAAQVGPVTRRQNRDQSDSEASSETFRSTGCRGRFEEFQSSP